MRLDEKAKENLEAVERLLDTDEEKDVDTMFNAATSRAYYAAYQAVVDTALRHGHMPERGQSHFRHDTLPNNAMHWQILSPDQREDLEHLRDLRVKADYFEDQVLLEEATLAAKEARAILDEVLGGAAP